MKKLLAHPWLYRAFKRVMVSPAQMESYVRERLRPPPEARVLDIGCGLADILDFLPDSCRYVGFDANPDYIRRARELHPRRNATFTCALVAEATLEGPGSWDLVLANGVLHHLDDGEAGALFRLAYAALREGGRLVTLDGAYAEGQSRVARWLLARDRGRFVRSPAAYEALARAVFPRVDSRLEHGMLRFPYTHLIMTCAKPDGASTS